MFSLDFSGFIDNLGPMVSSMWQILQWPVIISAGIGLALLIAREVKAAFGGSRK
jgi:hypothetical protein